MKADDLVRDHVYANVHPFIYPLFKMDMDAACDLFDLSEEEYIALCETREYEEPVREWVCKLDFTELEDVCNARMLDEPCTEEALLESLESDGDWEDFANEYQIDPFINEVYEHWLVDSWLAWQLESRGETVVDFGAGCRVWCRCTTGQAISMDYVIEKIAEEETK